MGILLSGKSVIISSLISNRRQFLLQENIIHRKVTVLPLFNISSQSFGMCAHACVCVWSQIRFEIISNRRERRRASERWDEEGGELKEREGDVRREKEVRVKMKLEGDCTCRGHTTAPALKTNGGASVWACWDTNGDCTWMISWEPTPPCPLCE